MLNHWKMSIHSVLYYILASSDQHSRDKSSASADNFTSTCSQTKAASQDVASSLTDNLFAAQKFQLSRVQPCLFYYRVEMADRATVMRLLATTIGIPGELYHRLRDQSMHCLVVNVNPRICNIGRSFYKNPSSSCM